MSSLYTNEVRNHLRSLPWPRGFKYLVVEYPGELRVVLYRQNINSLNSDDKLHLAKNMGEALRKINDQGIPMFLRVKAGDGSHDCEFNFHPECQGEDGCVYA